MLNDRFCISDLGLEVRFSYNKKKTDRNQNHITRNSDNKSTNSKKTDHFSS